MSHLNSERVQDVDLVERNENGAEVGRPFGTAPLQPLHKLNEKSPDVDFGCFSTVDDLVIERKSVLWISKEVVEGCSIVFYRLISRKKFRN